MHTRIHIQIHIQCRNTCSLVLSFKSGLFSMGSELAIKRLMSLMQGGMPITVTGGDRGGDRGGDMVESVASLSITDLFNNLVR